ncbi:MAG: FMN-binding protein [Bacteroidales bacterium]|nr:FMN-binding protein [Bacteroidales bacterium]
MKDKSIRILFAVLVAMMSLSVTVRAQHTYSNDSLVILTDSLASDVNGFNGPVPLKITIVKGIIENIEALPNQETPRFFNVVEDDLLPVWFGMTVKEALQLNVDVITGATYSSEAVIESVTRGLRYAQTVQPDVDETDGNSSTMMICIIGIIAVILIVAGIFIIKARAKAKS